MSISNKVGGNHTTLIEEADKLMREVIKLSDLKRYAPGFIDPKSKAKNKSKLIFSPQNSECLQMKVVSRRGTQIIFCYGNAKYLEENIEAIWKRIHP